MIYSSKFLAPLTSSRVEREVHAAAFVVGRRGGVHFADQVGATRVLMTDTNTVSHAFAYGPYGEQRWTLDLGVGGPHSHYHFTGKLHHTNIGLSYFPYRHYSAAQARWTTRDPIGMIDGPNVYAYVGGNPINRVDPLGLVYIDPACVLRCLFIEDVEDVINILKDKKLSRRQMLRLLGRIGKQVGPGRIVSACYCIGKCTSL